MLGAVAELERSLILERQKEGIALAKMKGKYKGGKHKLSAEKVSELKDMSPIFDKRANKRFITVSRLSSSSPAMRYTGKRLDCFD